MTENPSSTSTAIFPGTWANYVGKCCVRSVEKKVLLRKSIIDMKMNTIPQRLLEGFLDEAENDVQQDLLRVIL